MKMNFNSFLRNSWRNYFNKCRNLAFFHFTSYKARQTCLRNSPPILTLKSDFLNNHGTNRWFSTESGPPSNKLPPLMDFPKIMWPSIVKSLKNMFVSNILINPYFDQEFSMHDFTTGSKKAVEVVSKKVADGDFKTLDGLVTSDIIPQLQRSVSLMSLFQREQIAVSLQDIYFCFPYQIGIMFDDNDKKRFVEITMVFHALKGLQEFRDRGEDPPLNVGLIPEYQQRISVCNYRFIREFTKGVESDWTVNLLNHFKPAEGI